MGRRLKRFEICVDSREQNGWWWEPEEKKPGICQLLGCHVDKLDYGDYTIAGLEDEIVIERKNDIEELFGNYTPAKNKKRFHNEMERMSGVEHKYILIEQTLDQAMTYRVPQMRQIPSKRVVDWLIGLNFEYGVEIVFAGDYGQKYARMIFENFAKRHL